MNRIRIMTATRTDNNGTDLQALSMQYLFRRLGAEDIELIDYICPKLESKKHIFQFGSLRSIAFFPFRLYYSISHMLFRKKYFHKTKITYTSETLPSIKCEKIVVGSDQVWNIPLTGYDLSFFLPFEKKTFKKYSYAASFGATDLKQWNKDFHIKTFLNSFSQVSVREETAVAALSEINVNAHYDLDPILMSKKEDWTSFIQHPIRNKKYVLLYLIMNDSPAIDYARSIAKKNNWEVVNCSDSFTHISKVKKLRFVSIEKWLNLVAHAQIVVTSSYHCLAFSLLFNTEIRLMPIDNIQSNTRMSNLLERFGYRDHILGPEFNEPSPIDWRRFEEKLALLRFDSEEYVKSIINE